MPRIEQYSSKTEAAGPVDQRGANASDFGVGNSLGNLSQSLGEAADQAHKNEVANEKSSVVKQIAQSYQKHTERLLSIKQDPLAGSKVNNPQGSIPNQNPEQGSSSNSLQLPELGSSVFGAHGGQAADQQSASLPNETGQPPADLPSQVDIPNQLMPSVRDDMDKIEEGLSTREAKLFFAEHRATLEKHFGDEAIYAQSQYAGQVSANNKLQELNALSTTVAMSPAFFEHAVQINDSSWKDTSTTHGINAIAVLKQKALDQKELALSAINGQIHIDPKTAISQIETGRFDKYIDGEQKIQYLKAAQAEELRRSTQMSAAEVEAQEKSVKSLLVKIDQGTATPNDIFFGTGKNLPATGAGSQMQLLELMNKTNREGIVANPHVVQDVFNRIHLQDGDPKKITDPKDLIPMVHKDGIDLAHLNSFTAMIEGRRTQDGRNESDAKKRVINAAKSAIGVSNDGLGIKDTAGDKNFAKFIWDFESAYSAKRKAGKTADDLLNPNSKDYMGNFYQKYTKDTNQIFEERFNTPATTPNYALPTAPGTLPTPIPSSDKSSNYKYFSQYPGVPFEMGVDANGKPAYVKVKNGK